MAKKIKEAESGKVLLTGVDKLIELIKQTKRISIKEAAKKLGVSQDAVEEWADFLDEEGIIEIDYKFATPYLVEKKLTKKDIDTKAKEFRTEKQGFVRNVESMLYSIDKEREGLLAIKEEFNKLKKDLGSEFEEAREEMQKLSKFEDLKNNVDKQLIKQQHEFEKRVEGMNKQIINEQKKFHLFLEKIKQEKLKLNKEKTTLSSEKEKETALTKKLELFEESVKKLKQDIEKDTKVIDISGKEIKKLERLADSVREHIIKKKEMIDSLIEESKKKEEEVLKQQKKVIEGIIKKKEKMKDEQPINKRITNKFKKLLEKKVQIGRAIATIEKRRTDLRSTLNELIKKANAVHLATKEADLYAHIKKLEKKFSEVDKKKGSFENEVKKLGKLLLKK